MTAAVETRPLREEDIDEAVRLHRASIPYSLNSSLGVEHLAACYGAMLEDSENLLSVALVDGAVAGIVVATADAGSLQQRILRRMPPRSLLRSAAALLLSPALIRELARGWSTGRPVLASGREVRASIVAIAVDPSRRNLGLGRRLVADVDGFVRRRSLHAYRLETRADNATSRRFYARTGFREVAVRGPNLILVRCHDGRSH